MKIIDATNGNFSLNSEMIIKINQHFDEVYSFNLEKTSNNIRNDYEWIHFRNLKIENLYFSVGVCFLKSKTKLINFSFAEADLNYKNWDNWAEKEELNKLEKFEKWLNENIGKQREFNWGKISANIDIKGGGTSMLLSYN